MKPVIKKSAVKRSLNNPCRFIATSILGLIALSGTSVYADGDVIRVNQQAQSVHDKPRNGQTMVQVESKYGMPTQKISPVGEPPITRWEYSHFTVYFEHNKVIHAVAHKS